MNDANIISILLETLHTAEGESKHVAAADNHVLFCLCYQGANRLPNVTIQDMGVMGHEGRQICFHQRNMFNYHSTGYTQ